jgi:hypothetical protein
MTCFTQREARACWEGGQSLEASFSPWQEEPFRDRSPFWDQLWEGQLPNEDQEPFEGVFQCLDLYATVAAYLVLEVVQGVPH